MNHRRRLAFPLVTLAASLLVACGGSTRTQIDPFLSAGAGAGAGDAGAGAGAGANVDAGAGGVTGDGFGGGGSGGRIIQIGLGGEENRGPTLLPGSWSMKGAVTVLPAPSTGFDLNCTGLDFALTVALVDKAYQLTVGTDGVMDGAPATLEGGDYYTEQHISLPSGSGCRGVTLNTVEGLRLFGNYVAPNTPSNQLEGSVMAQAMLIQGDLAITRVVQIDLVGTPDVNKPTLLVPETINPLFPPLIRASEPISTEAALTLVGTTQEPLTALAATNSHSMPIQAVINFGTDTILPLSGTWAVEGSAPDLAGNPLGAGGTLHTLADPGLFAQDGFEGPLVAASEATGSSLVTAVGTILAISGKRSLWLPPLAALTFHLQRAGKEKSVRFSMQVFSHQGGASSADIRVGVVGGKTIDRPTLPAPGTPVETGDATWQQAAPVQQISVPITDPGTDVLVRMTAPSCYGFCPPQVALMIDDLRLE